MSDHVTREPKPGDGTSLPDLVDAYRQQRDALRAQLDGLSALRKDLRAAAEQEGRDIVERARRDVDRTILRARQQLLALTTQVRVALEDASAASAVTDRQEVLGDAHLDLGALLDTSQPGLDALAADVRELGEIVGPTLPEDEVGAFDPNEFPSESVVTREPVTPAAATTRPTADPRAVARAAPPAPSAVPATPPQARAGTGQPPATAAPAHRDQGAAPPVGLPTPRDSAGPPASPVGAPAKATDLSALVGELVARRTADASAGHPGAGADAVRPAGEGAHTGPGLSRLADRSGGLFAAAGMPVNRGVRLFAWLQARSHLLPAVVGVAVTLLVVATWFRDAPDPAFFEDGIAVVEPGDAGTDPGLLQSASGEQVPVMRLEARREVWVQITVDGRQDGGRTLQPGDVEVITTGDTIAIRAGDAGALWVSVRGGTAEPLGPDGGVLTRTFAIEATPAADNGSGPVSAGDRLPQPSSTAGASTAGAGARPAVQPPPSPAQETPSARSAPASAGDAPASLQRTAATAPPPGATGRTTAAPAPASASAVSATSGPPPELQLVAAAERWFESYYRRLPFEAFDQPHRPSVADGRDPDTRLPEGLWEVDRRFDDVQVRVVADTAIYSARMIERGQAGPESPAHTARVSQVWVRRNTGWLLMDVKLLTEFDGRP